MPSVFPEWLNANSGRSYPLMESATKLDVSGNIGLPNSLIVDARINLAASHLGGTFFVSSVHASPSVIKIGLSFELSGNSRLVSAIEVPVSTHVENSTYLFAGAGDDSAVIGSLTIGNLFETLNWLPGLLDFDSSSTPFETSCLFFSSPAIEAVEVYSGSSLIGRFETVLKLRAGENIRLSLVDDDPNTIRIDAIAGENLRSPDECENATPLPACIRTINGVPGDENGNFAIDGGKCISAEVSAGLIRLRDLCSSSCCGCNEMEQLMASLKLVEAQLEQVRLALNTTTTQQTLMISNLVSNIGK